MESSAIEATRVTLSTS